MSISPKGEPIFQGVISIHWPCYCPAQNSQTRCCKGSRLHSESGRSTVRNPGQVIAKTIKRYMLLPYLLVSIYKEYSTDKEPSFDKQTSVYLPSGEPENNIFLSSSLNSQISLPPPNPGGISSNLFLHFFMQGSNVC